MNDDDDEIAGDEWGYLLTRDYPSGLRTGVDPLLWGKARLCIGTVATWGDGGFDREFHYESVASAIAALLAWDGEGEPEGWFRNPDTGRRRPGNDPTKEFIRP